MGGVPMFPRRVLFLTVLFFLMAAPVWADNGPHGNYSAYTDDCAGCHRSHVSRENHLLITNTSYDLCMTCHGEGGNGADTNVMDGVYLQRDTVTEPTEEGVANRGLLGGGFRYARMDTGFTGNSSAASVTSSHIWNESGGTVWGSGGIGSGPGGGMTLTCISCHNPHGGEGDQNSATYRILRAIPIGSGGSSVIIPDENPKNYTVDDGSGKYFGEHYNNNIDQDISRWCAQCHDRYLASAGSGHTDSGDPIFGYRHISVGQGCGCHNMHGGPPPTGNPAYRHNPLSCLTCHVAHGTSARMGGSSGSVPWPNGSSSPGGNARSALLRVNNRGVCQLCHDK